DATAQSGGISIAGSPSEFLEVGSALSLFLQGFGRALHFRGLVGPRIRATHTDLSDNCATNLPLLSRFLGQERDLFTVIFGPSFEVARARCGYIALKPGLLDGSSAPGGFGTRTRIGKKSLFGRDTHLALDQAS